MPVPPSPPERGTSEANEHGPRSANGAAEEHLRTTKVEEPDTSGTVFLTLVLLMLIFGFWVMMYVVLIDH